MEAEVSVGGGVQVRRADPPPSLLVEHHRRARLDLATVGAVARPLDVPAARVNNSLALLCSLLEGEALFMWEAGCVAH